MSIFKLCVIVCLPCLAILALAGGPNPTDTPAPPKLEHFDPTFTDSSLDPCTDFYKYACSKWQAANPIPADQVAWGTGSGLQLERNDLERDNGERFHLDQSDSHPGTNRLLLASLHERGRTE